jgi:predicted nucleotidyltransferase
MDNIEKTTQHFFKNKSGIVSVHLFGSQVKGYANEKSDVDCAILFERDSILKPLDLIELRESLSSVLHKEVDLVCLNTASPIISMQIYKHGKVIINNNSKLYAKYIINLFTDYCDLKILRKPMENAILNRKYYG